MDYEQEQGIVAQIKKYVTENLPLSQMSDEALEEKVEEITGEIAHYVDEHLDQFAVVVKD